MTNPKLAQETFDPKLGDIADRLKELARKAALLSLAVTGLMEIRQHDEEEPLRDAADQISVELTAIAAEIRQ